MVTVLGNLDLDRGFRDLGCKFHTGVLLDDGVQLAISVPLKANPFHVVISLNLFGWYG
jgi:hypothetical protein